jgi:hypothetical protein
MLRQVPTDSRTIGDAYQDKERLLFHNHFERLLESIPVLFIQNAHKIEKQRFFLFLLFLAFFLRFDCFLLLRSFLLLLFQSFLELLLFGQIFFKLFELFLTILLEL